MNKLRVILSELKDIFISLFKPTSQPIIFHGGCHGCTQQMINGVEFCIKCQYFQADWSLPNLNNRQLDTSEVVRRQLKRRFNI